MYVRHTIETPDGCHLAAFDAGSQDAPTAILAHGWSLDHHTWDKVARLLLDAGWRVVTWDQRGHGQSTLPYRAEASIHALARDLEQVRQTLVPHGRVFLAGHSMGGMTLLAYSGLYPKVVKDRVERLVLVSTSAGDLPMPDIAPFLTITDRIPFHLGSLITTYSQRLIGFGRSASRDDVRLARDQVGATSIATMSRFYTALEVYDETASLKALADTDVRILVGSKDRLTPPRHARALAQALPGANLEILPKLGHMLPYEAPGVVTGAITGARAAA